MGGHVVKRAWGALALVLALVAGCGGGTAPPAGQPGLAAAGTATVQLVSFSFSDARHGWAAARQCAPASGSPPSQSCRSVIYRSTDGGQTWSVADRFLLTPRALQFSGPTIGWMIGSIGERCGSDLCPNVIMRSENAGTSWDRASTVSAELLDQAAVSPTDDWALGQQCVAGHPCTAVLVQTSSAGQLWSNQNLPLAGTSFSLQRLTSNVAWVAGIDQGKGVLLATTDGGTTWSRRATDCAGRDLTVDFTSPSQGWLACVATSGAVTVYRTGDAGQNWQALPPLAADPTTSANGPVVAGLAFVSAQTGWLALQSGAVWVTHDGGGTWQLGLQTKEALVGVTFLDPRHGWVLGQGTVWRTTDGGQSWHPTTIL